MKRIITLTLFTTLSITAFSQKLEVNQVDEFTGKMVKKTSEEALLRNMKAYTFIYFRQVQSDIFMNVKFMVAHMKASSVNKGDPFYFKFQDGTILKVPCLEYTVTQVGAASRGMGGSLGNGINISYLLTKDDLSLLQTKLISKFRIQFSDGYNEYEVDAKHAKQIQKTANLITIQK